MPTTLRRVRPRAAGGEDDRLSALPDDLILLILSRLDTRTALSTAALARSWAPITRELPALDFRVSDILPPEYDRTVALRRRNLPREPSLANWLDHRAARCETDTMRSFANGVTSFLEGDGGHDRRVKTLRLEFFQTYDGICADRLITAAVGAWGVEDLEIVVRLATGDDQTPAYSLPHDCLNLRSRLRSLTLGKYCTVPPLHSYGALTRLVLRDIPASTPVNVYETVFKDCTGLQVLHLTSCWCAHHTLVVDAPCSQIRELVMEECSFIFIELRDLPMLVRLACCLTNTAKIVFGSVPCLMDTNLTFLLEDDCLQSGRQWVDNFDSFLDMSPTMTNLVIRFTRLRRWIRACLSERKLPDLKRLLVADMPSNWDISWTRGLLTASPFLEVLHIHVPHSETEPDYLRGMNWSKSRNNFRHHHLKELVVIGFTQRNIWLLKYVVRVCTSLQRVVLLKAGHVRYTGLWDWQMVGQQICAWSDDEKMVPRRMIKEFGLKPLVELILG